MITHPSETLFGEDNPHDTERTIRTRQRTIPAFPPVDISGGPSALDFLFGTGFHKGRNIQDQPKLEFLDSRLPKLDDLEIPHRIRSNKRSPLEPVVIFTPSRGIVKSSPAIIPEPIAVSSNRLPLMHSPRP